MGPSVSKRAAILGAAERLFLRHGLHGTSMEAIARTAGVAKPTLYACYGDKQAVFAAVTARRLATWRDEFHAALAGGDTASARVAGALVGREKAAMELRDAADASPFGADEASRLALRAHEDELRRALEAVLAEARLEQPRLMAQLLLAAARGIGQTATLPAELGPALRLLCERLLRPAGG